MKAKKIIVEIDGERHRLVKGRISSVGSKCVKCSLFSMCGEVIDPPCVELEYFVKEKEQKRKIANKEDSCNPLFVPKELCKKCYNWLSEGDVNFNDFQHCEINDYDSRDYLRGFRNDCPYFLDM